MTCGFWRRHRASTSMCSRRARHPEAGSVHGNRLSKSALRQRFPHRPHRLLDSVIFNFPKCPKIAPASTLWSERHSVRVRVTKRRQFSFQQNGSKDEADCYRIWRAGSTSVETPKINNEQTQGTINHIPRCNMPRWWLWLCRIVTENNIFLVARRRRHSFGFVSLFCVDDEREQKVSSSCFIIGCCWCGMLDATGQATYSPNRLSSCSSNVAGPT